MKFKEILKEENVFSCPGMPIVPWCALCCNVGLMVLLPVAAWIRLGIVSLLIYSYSKWNSDGSDQTSSASRRRSGSGENGKFFASSSSSSSLHTIHQDRQQIPTSESSDDVDSPQLNPLSPGGD
mmetsp:Transcript_10867/g.13143  ORF Transcript_10867/g.13143 Transcript_10867/m.13143 type:complete len:124 (+) Transcript_10867:2-373(+)